MVTVEESFMTSNDDGAFPPTDCEDDPAEAGEMDAVLVDRSGVLYCILGFVHARAFQLAIMSTSQLSIDTGAAAEAATSEDCAEQMLAKFTDADAIFELWIAETSTLDDVFGPDVISAAHGIDSNNYQLTMETSLGDTCTADDCSSRVTVAEQVFSVESCIEANTYTMPYRTFMQFDGVMSDAELFGGDEDRGSLALRAGLDYYCARYEFNDDGFVIYMPTDEKDQPRCYGPGAAAEILAGAYVKFTASSYACCATEPPCGSNGECVPIFPDTYECVCAPGFFPPSCLSADELCGNWSPWTSCLPPGCETQDSLLCRPRQCGGCRAIRNRFRSCPMEVPESYTIETEECDTSRKCIRGIDSALEILQIGTTRKGRKFIRIRHRRCCLLYSFGRIRPARPPRGCYRRRAAGWQ